MTTEGRSTEQKRVSLWSLRGAINEAGDEVQTLQSGAAPTPLQSQPGSVFVFFSFGSARLVLNWSQFWDPDCFPTN